MDTSGALGAEELVEAVACAERERAAQPDQVPLGEWEAWRIRPHYSHSLTTQALLQNAEEAKELLEVGFGFGMPPLTW